MKCVLPFSAFEAGDTAIIYVYDPNILISTIVDIQDSSTVIFAQVHGHAQVNERWLKGIDSLTPIFNDDEEFRSPIDHVLVPPSDPKADKSVTSSFCLFTTSKVPVSPQQLADCGVFLEFDIPNDLLSSYKSRSMNVDYYVTIHVQNLSFQKIYHFPFIIHSLGSAMTPYYTRVSSLAVYPINAIPIDRVLSNELNLLSNIESVDSQRQAMKLQNLKSYKVRDVGKICIVQVPTTHFQLGKAERMVVNYSESEQDCYAIRANIVLIEKQIKDSLILQEKVIFSETKLTSNAEEIVFSLTVPSDYHYSFASPIIQVQYKISLEFYLSDQQQVEPLSFSFPIEISSYSSQWSNTPTSGKKYTKNELQNLCLQSKFSKIGMIDLIEATPTVP